MQESGSTDSLIEALKWIAIVIALLIVFWVVWVRLRKWQREEPRSTAGEAPWTLQQLREMRESGQLSEQEYEHLKQQMIGSFKDTSSAQQS